MPWYVFVISLCGNGCCYHTEPEPEPPIATKKPHVSIKNIHSWHDPDETLLCMALAAEEEQALDDLHDYAVAHFPSGQWNYLIPDMSYREIVLVFYGQRFELRSSHPLAEKNPNLVATSGGVTTLDGKSGMSVLAQDDPDFVAARSAFDHIQAELLRHFGAKKSPDEKPKKSETSKSEIVAGDEPTVTE